MLAHNGVLGGYGQTEQGSKGNLGPLCQGRFDFLQYRCSPTPSGGIRPKQQMGTSERKNPVEGRTLGSCGIAGIAVKEDIGYPFIAAFPAEEDTFVDSRFRVGGNGSPPLKTWQGERAIISPEDDAHGHSALMSG